MYFKVLAEKLLDPNEPAFTVNDWPTTLYYPTETTPGWFSQKNKFWTLVKDVHKFTINYADKFTEKHEGSTGWEYSFIMIYAAGSIFYSKPVTSKEYTSVSSKYQLGTDMIYNKTNLELYDKVLLNGYEVGRVRWKGEPELKKRSQLIEQKKFKLGFIANFHTHPLSQYPQYGIDKKIYSFFSGQDMASFFGSSMKMTGLITDKLWIACKTDLSTIPSAEDIQSMTQAEAYDAEHFEEIIEQVMNKYHIVIYKAEFGKNLQRLNYPSAY